MFIKAGLPRNERTLRRYCVRGELICRKTENASHQLQYFVDADSVETYIAQQKTLLAAGPAQSGRAWTGPELNEAKSLLRSSDNSIETDGPTRTSPDVPAIAPHPEGPSELVEQLRERLVDKDEEIKFLRSELQHRRTTDSALHDVIAAFRANAEAQRLSAAPYQATPDAPGQARHEPEQGSAAPFV